MKEGLIPTVLGAGVTASGIAMHRKLRQNNNNMMRKEMWPMIAAGVIGFGLANILLGTIDLVED